MPPSNKEVKHRANRTRPLRKGEFGADDMKRKAKPVPAMYSKYDVILAKLQKHPTQWYTVNWHAAKGAAESTASALRRRWDKVIVLVEDSDDERGGYDLVACYYEGREAFIDAGVTYYSHVDVTS